MTLIALALSLQDSRPPDPSALVSKMIQRYHGAATIGGTVGTRLRWDDQELTIQTTLWLERPGKLYLKQVTSVGSTFLVTADGNEFSYDKPLSGQVEDLQRGGRLLEAQAGKTLQDVYAIASLSIAERSTPLDLAIARIDDLRMLRNQWVSVEAGPDQRGGTETLLTVVGKWTSNPEYGTLGKFEMAITPEGDLRRFRVVGRTDDGKGEIVREHVVDLKVGATPPQGQFTVAR
jgi:hypothetical protein